jgi:microcystin-dependent protein
MAKNKISEYSATASNNTDIGGINIAEGCAPSGINNAIRELMAQLKDQQTGTDADSFVVGGAFTCTGAAVFSSTVALGASATATTQSANDNSTKVATTAYVAAVIPDLRDRFVVGAGSTYAVGNTGGTKDAIVVSHSHSISDSGHSHDVRIPSRAVGNNATALYSTSDGSTKSTVTSDSANTGISINSTGDSGTNANLPPYYALCYIQKA